MMLDMSYQIKIDKLLKYKIDGLALDYTEVSDLRKNLNAFFENEISDYTREDIVDYVEGLIPDLMTDLQRRKSLNFDNEDKKLLNNSLLNVMSLQLKELEKWVVDKRTILDDSSDNEEKMIIDDIIAPVKWKGTPTELIELVRALLESNVLDRTLTDKEIVSRFGKFFDVNTSNYAQTQTKIRGRIKDFSIFTKKLDINLEHWVKNKD